jgi:hypothetical protein
VDYGFGWGNVAQCSQRVTKGVGWSDQPAALRGPIVFPLIFFAAFYGLFCIAIAMAAYAFTQGSNKSKQHGRMVFMTILAFGAFSLFGVVCAALLTVLTVPRSSFQGNLLVPFLIVYAASGIAGSWLFVWSVQEFVKWSERRSPEKKASAED